MIEDLYGYDYDFNDIVVDVTQTTKQTFIVNLVTGEDGIQQPVLEHKKDDYGNVIPPVVTQEATIQWLCGTLPIQVKVGDYTFGQVTDPTKSVEDVAGQLDRAATTYGGDVTPEGTVVTGTGPDISTKDITGWNPSTNNITAFVWTKGTSPQAAVSYSKEGLRKGGEGIWVSTFPVAGAVPYIIAVDQNVKWMAEEVHVPTTWIGGDMSIE